MPQEIDLHEYITPKEVSLHSRDMAEELRHKFRLDRLDKEPQASVTIVIPHWVRVVNYTFFKALLGKSVLNLGIKKFIERYKFEYEGDVNKVLGNCIAQVWEEAHPPKSATVLALEDDDF